MTPPKTETVENIDKDINKDIKKLNPIDFTALKRVLWIRMAVISSLFLISIMLYDPYFIKYAVSGIFVGIFFLGSLMFSADHPRGRVQVVFSLTRMVLLAYIIVMLGDFRLQETGIVICGFLSYKVGLLIEYVKQAFKVRAYKAY